LNQHIAYTQDNNYAARDWTLYGSNNDSTWDAIESRTNQTAMVWGAPQTYVLSVPVEYRYYVFHVTKKDPTTARHVGFGVRCS
jgi:hypothetical protein